jgi:DNA helicase-2/ATP-dependent DNA helicase PcrA
VNYKEVQNWYPYINDKTPFSTQHGIKGAEFDNVLIVLGDSNWTKYNFHNLFKSDQREKIAVDDSIYKRTLKLFYVCCTRAKENLVIFYSNPSLDCIATARKWFGENNVYRLDEFLDLC